MYITDNFFIHGKQLLLRKGKLPDCVWALKYQHQRVKQTHLVFIYVKNKQVSVYLPLSFCGSDLFIQIPAHRHQYHSIIRCVLQSNFLYCNHNGTNQDIFRICILNLKLSLSSFRRRQKKISHRRWIRMCRLQTRLNCTTCRPSVWWGRL